MYDRLLYWSAESRLDSANHEGDMVRYDYNALGKPVIKYRRGTTSSWYAYSYYIWDGDQLLIELDLNKKRNADFVYYPGTIDQPIAHGIGDSTVTAIRDFRSDAEGNTLATVVDGDYIQSQDTYDAWGTPAHDGQLNSALFWKGLKWEGDAVNLYFVRNRWYDPELGRFASEDPIGHDGGENLYTYANNDPINGSDPSGMMQCYEGYHEDGDKCVMNPVVVTARSGGGNWWSGMSGFSTNFGNRIGNPWANMTGIDAFANGAYGGQGVQSPSPERKKMAQGITLVLPATQISVLFSDKGIQPSVCGQLGGLLGYTNDTYLYKGSAPSDNSIQAGPPWMQVSVHGNGVGTHFGFVAGSPISVTTCGSAGPYSGGYGFGKIGYTP